jgi:hypothetical protein
MPQEGHSAVKDDSDVLKQMYFDETAITLECYNLRTTAM